MKYYTILLLCLFSLLQSCKNDKSNEIERSIESDIKKPAIKLSPNRPDLNVSILLDLSDRISPEKHPNGAMEYYLRDIGYIKSIAEAFEIHLRNKRSIMINDKIQLFLNPEPSDKNLNEKIKNLKISFNKNNATKDLILKTSNKYDSITKLVYESAIAENEYIGSDIWKFFKNKVKDYCIEDDHRNILFILTDGYIYHKDTKRKENNRTTYITPQVLRRFQLNDMNWEAKFTKDDYGFINATDDLSNLEVVVLGINPNKNNQYEEDVLTRYWSEWLEKMDVSSYELKLSDLPSNMDKLIKDYIFTEI